MSLLRGQLFGQKPRTEWRVVFNCFQVKWILSQFHKLYLNKKNWYITAALLQVGLVCATFGISGLICFNFQPVLTWWRWGRLSSPQLFISAAPALFNSTCCCKKKKNIIPPLAVVWWLCCCAPSRPRSRRFVCIGAALGNSLFTLCVFVVDSQPTHDSTLCVSLQEVRGAPSATAPNKVSTCVFRAQKHTA